MYLLHLLAPLVVVRYTMSTKSASFGHLNVRDFRIDFVGNEVQDLHF